MRVRHFLRTAALAALIMALGPGCRGPHPYPVSGRVVYDDGETASDLVGAAVIFTSDELKVSVARDDPFVGRPLIQNFIGHQANYHEDRRGRPRKEKQPAPVRKRGRKHEVPPDISDLRIMPIPPPIFLDGHVSQF